jgi:hypothetical protein
VKETITKTDQQGKITLKDLPIGLYTVEVSGNDEFLSSKREINILNDEDKDELIIYVAMKPRNDSNI